MKALDTPLARELAETYLLQADLHGSLATFRLWVQRYVETPDAETQTLLDSLFRDAVVQFTACFDPRATVPLNVDLIYGEDSGAQAYIEWFRDLRNSYAAHRYGASRQCAVGVITNPDTGEFVGFGKMLLLYSGPIPSAHQALLRFVETAARFVDDQVETVAQEFEKAARALSAAERLALPTARTYGLDVTESGLSRSDLQRRRGKGATKTEHE